MYWDIALHIDVGRDTGPADEPRPLPDPGRPVRDLQRRAASPCSSRASRSAASALRITRDWHAPLGGVLICAAGAFALAGFPLDDGWHRLFGQDVTLWGPTHLMLIGGAVMTLIGIAVLQVEGGRAKGAAPAGDERLGWLMQLRRYSMAGGLLIGLSTFQGEFDYGVPQFRLVFGPVLIMFAAAVALVAMRLWLGRGAALGAVAFFLVDSRRDHARGRAGAGRGGRPLPALHRRGALRRGGRAWSFRASGRCASRLVAAPRSGPSASPPSGPGRMSGARSRGRHRCSPRARCSGSPRRSAEPWWAPGSARAWRPRAAAHALHAGRGGHRRGGAGRDDRLRASTRSGATASAPT